VLYHRSFGGKENLLYVELTHAIAAHERELLELYAINVALTFENLSVMEEMHATQGEMVSMLGDAVEQRGTSSAAHVQRVARISQALARAAGQDDTTARLILLAAPLHDVGKITVSDSILLKAGALDPDEWAAMKAHTEKGAELLGRSRRDVMQLAATIARAHHEHWDGSGYPAGLAGASIPFAGRVVSLADAFDSLASDRPYRARWSDDEIRAYLTEQAGKRFDPQLVSLLLADFARYVALRAEVQDA